MDVGTSETFRIYVKFSLATVAGRLGFLFLSEGHAGMFPEGSGQSVTHLEGRKLLDIRHRHFWYRSRGSSGSRVSDYGLDDRPIEVRSPAETKYFSSTLCVQTGSGAHPASCPMGTGGPFLGVKRGRGVTLTTHPHLVPRSWMSRIYISSPPKRLHGV
jgi:hypothetical protein